MLRAGHGLILAVLALLMFGVVMINSAGLTVDAEDGLTLQRVFTSRSTIYAAVALCALLIASRIPIEHIYTARGVHSPIPWIVLGMFVMMALVHVPGLAREMNGSARWLSIGGLSIQPSEAAKWGMIVVLAWYGARHAGAMHKLTVGFLPTLWFVGAVCVLIALEDLGTAVLIGTVAVLLLLAAGIRLWQALLVAPAGLAFFVAMVVQSPYRVQRLMAYLDPYQDPQGIGYHIIQSMSAVAGGGIAGRGLGNGVRKFGYLPEDTTDFIFAIVCEELGAFGAAFVLFLYAALLLSAFLIVRRAAHPFARLLGVGIMLTIGLQAAINIAVVSGVAPTKGIALPLLSHGGTGWALTAFSIGLLVSMDRAQQVHESSAARTVGQTADDDELFPHAAAPA